jgi:chromate transporter
MVDAWLLIELFVTFARLGLIAIGGMQTVLTEVYREVVSLHGWMSAADLANVIALTQASPGPNGQFVSLIGLRVAGVPGFFVAGIALALPPAILAFTMGRVKQRLATARWLRSAQAGLVPIVVGLILASGLVSAEAADDTWIKVGLTVVVALVVWRSRWNPLWLLALGAVLGVARL